MNFRINWIEFGRFLLVASVAVSILYSGLFFFAAASFVGGGSQPEPMVIQKSSSGRFEASQKWVRKSLYNEKLLPYYEFTILDLNDHSLYQVPINFSARHRTRFTWDQEERLWIYSGDIGTYIFSKDKLNDWVSTTWRESGLPKPPGLP